MSKNHTWSTGYIAKLFLDQTWLLGQTTDWKLIITFCQEVLELKVSPVMVTMSFCFGLGLVEIIYIATDLECRHSQSPNQEKVCQKSAKRGDNKQVLESIYLPMSNAGIAIHGQVENAIANHILGLIIVGSLTGLMVL